MCIIKNFSIIRLVLLRASIFLLMLYLYANTQTYRLLVAFTPNASDSIRVKMGMPVKQYVEDNIVSQMNAGYNNSKTSANVELAGISRVEYTESGNMNTDLGRLQTSGDGYIDTVHTLRSNYAADVVTMLQNHNVTMGLGFFDVQDFQAFSTMHWITPDWMNIPGHEIGHNFSCRHDTTDDPNNTPYTYGHGFVGPPADHWGTIMSVMGIANYYRNFYSNPDSTYGGVDRGTVLRCNNNRIHNERASTIAGFRSPTSNVTISNRIFKANDFGDVMATNTITVNGPDTLRDSSELWLRATNTVTINSNFTVKKLASLTIRTGAGALSKRNKYSDIEYDIERKSLNEGENAQHFQELGFNIVSNSKYGSKLTYFLPVGTFVTFKIYDLQGKLISFYDLGYMEAGNHYFVPTIKNAVATKIYIIEMLAGKTRFTKRFAPL